MTISSRDDSSKKKVGVNGAFTKYHPIELCDDEVFDRAKMYYTAREIADRFGISEETLLRHHGEAYQKGKDEACQKPRVLLNKVMLDFSNPDLNFSRKDVPTQTLLNAVELKHKLYDERYPGVQVQGAAEVTFTVTPPPCTDENGSDER